MPSTLPLITVLCIVFLAAILKGSLAAFIAVETPVVTLSPAIRNVQEYVAHNSSTLSL